LTQKNKSVKPPAKLPILAANQVIRAGINVERTSAVFVDAVDTKTLAMLAIATYVTVTWSVRPSECLSMLLSSSVIVEMWL